MKIADLDTKEASKVDCKADRMVEQATHPFVRGMANAGAILGRDIGVLALRAIEAATDVGQNAVLFWTADRVPEAIRAQMPEGMLANLHGAMIVPHGASFPAFTFQDVKVRTASRTLVDGSTLLVFESAADEDAAAA